MNYKDDNDIKIVDYLHSVWDTQITSEENKAWYSQFKDEFKKRNVAFIDTIRECGSFMFVFNSALEVDSIQLYEYRCKPKKYYCNDIEITVEHLIHIAHLEITGMLSSTPQTRV